MIDVSHTASLPFPTAPHHWITRTVLGVIIALGLFFRLWGIAGESVWFDEFVSLILLKAPPAYVQSPHYERWNQTAMHQEPTGLSACLSANRNLDPATMPAYPAMEYLWNRFVSDSVLSLRLCSVCIGVLLMLMIYLFARDLFGPVAGLVAAFCVALSPVHRYYGQEIRVYVLTTFLALLSAYSFFHVLRGGRRRWWLLHVAANTLLPWTHVFGLLVPMVEGLWLALFHLRDVRRILAWGMVHGVLFIPLVFYIQTLQFWPAEQTSSWQNAPGRAEFFSDLLVDDAAGMTHQIRATPTALARFVPSGWADVLVEARHSVGWCWMGIVVALALWLVLRTPRPPVPSSGEDTTHPPRRWLVFLLMWWLLPATALYVASLLWRPCIFPRYTLSSSLALYIIIGGAVAAIRRRHVRIAAVCLVGLFFAYQDLLVLGEPQRPDWLSAAAHIRQNAKPDDLIVVENSSWKRVFAYNLGPVENVLGYANEPDVLGEMCAFFLEQKRPSKYTPEEPRGVWAVVQLGYFKDGPDEPFEKELTARGLTFTRAEFSGFQHVLVYRVRPGSGPEPGARSLLTSASDAATEFGELAMEFWRAKEYSTAVAACRKSIEFEPNRSRTYSYMGMALKEMGEKDAALEAFRKAVQLNPADYIWSYSNIGGLLAEKGDYDGAIAAYRKAVEINPAFALGYAGLGRALVAKADYDAAVEAFRRATELNPNDSESQTLLRDAAQRKSRE